MALAMRFIKLSNGTRLRRIHHTSSTAISGNGLFGSGNPNKHHQQKFLENCLADKNERCIFINTP